MGRPSSARPTQPLCRSSGSSKAATVVWRGEARTRSGRTTPAWAGRELLGSAAPAPNLVSVGNVRAPAVQEPPLPACLLAQTPLPKFTSLRSPLSQTSWRIKLLERGGLSRWGKEGGIRSKRQKQNWRDTGRGYF